MQPLTCPILACGAPVFAKGLCAKHYARQRRKTPLTQADRTPAGEATSFSQRCTLEQLEAWQQAAKKAKKLFSQWVRDALDKEAK